MPRLIHHMATTVDGFIAREDGSFGDFPLGDHVDDYLTALRAYGSAVMGRRTYEVGLAAGVTDPYPWLDTHVVSRTMEASPDPRVHLVRDAPEVVRDLKSRDGGDIYLVGGAELAATLYDARLVDELVVKLNPLLFGSGIPLTRPLSSIARLELHSTRRYESGVVLLRYTVR